MIENISIMIIVNVKEHKQGSYNPPMAYRAATYGFRNQRLSEIVSLVIPSTEHSHARKPSGSPINPISAGVSDQRLLPGGGL